MKKNILLILLLASVSVQAQDTLWQRVAPLSNYFYNNWIDTSDRYVNNPTYMYGCVIMTKRFIVNDSNLQVYGIAAMLGDEFFGYHAFLTEAEINEVLKEKYPEDPTVNNCETSLLLYQYHKNGSPQMQQLGDSLHVHRIHTKPTHIMMTFRTPMANYMDTMPKPIYERYFQTPQTVHDTFYAGFTSTNLKFDSINSIWYMFRPIFGCFSLDHHCEGVLYLSYNEATAYISPYNTNWCFSENECFAYYIFPILTPPDTTFTGNDTIAFGDTIVVVDTLIIGGDTIITYDTILSVHDNDLTSRLAGVLPNPAAEKARVVSSFGMSLVEVFDLNGSAVLKRRTEGLYTDIDVSHWPTGTYLVRIHTPQGIVTKKLVVSR